MPANQQPLAEEKIAAIEKWIDDGCPDYCFLQWKQKVNYIK